MDLGFSSALYDRPAGPKDALRLRNESGRVDRLMNSSPEDLLLMTSREGFVRPFREFSLLQRAETNLGNMMHGTSFEGLEMVHSYSSWCMRALGAGNMEHGRVGGAIFQIKLLKL